MSELGILPQPIPFGKYYLLERVNIGGMAEIFKAKAFGVDGFERLLAIKKILSSIAEDESFINMFIDEAKIAGQLNHPNIAQIFDLGKVDGSYFIALEYISGKDLKTIFERSRRIGEKVSIPRVCYLMMKVCEGLGHAHHKKDAQGRDLNIVHRDVSPQNILMSYEGEVKIIDFGIAKAQGKTSQTQVGILKGKFSYMSPEQVRGLHIDHRSDIFSLGIVLYEMLTLERLFLGESDFDTLEKIRKVEMSPPSLYNPHIPKELENIVLKALAKSPEDRFQTAYEFADALEQFMRNQGYYYTNKDLGAYMKESFSADIDFENKKVEYYRSLNLQAPVEAPAPAPAHPGGGPGLSWGDDERDTHLFDRNAHEDIDEVELSLADIVYAPETGVSKTNTAQHDSIKPKPVTPAPGPAPSAPPAAARQRDPDDPPTVEYNRAAIQASLDEFAFDDEPMGNSFNGVPTPGSQPRPRLPTAQIPSIEPRRENTHTLSAVPSPAAVNPPDNGGTSLFKVLIVAILVVAIGAGIIYLVWPWPAEITFNPDGVSKVVIKVDGTVIYDGPTPYTYKLAPGLHTVEVSSNGYQTFKLTQDFEKRRIYNFSEKLPPEGPDNNNPTILVKTTPSDATVSIKDKKYDDASSPKKIKDFGAGEYKIVVSRKGYEPATKSLKLSKDDKEKTIDVSLKPRSLLVTLTSDPTKAEYSIVDTKDNKTVAKGKTPDTLKKLTGDKTYKVTVEKKGFKPFTYMLEPADDAKPTVVAKMEKDGSDNTGPTVAVNNPKKDNPKIASPKRDTPKKDRPKKKTVPKKKKDPPPKKIVKKPTGTASLTVASKPQARVYIDGKDTGRYTPLVNFKVPAKKLKVELVNPKFGLRKVIYVTLEAGEKKRVINRPPK